MFSQWLTLLSLLLLGSCGQKSFPDYHSDEEQRVEETGYYRANFRSVNGRFTGSISGYTIVWANERQFYAKVSLRTSIPEIMHYQFIHSGSRCPTSRADLDRDGKIDYEEVLAFSGHPLIPLDQDLRSAMEGFNWFPSSNEKGDYTYSRASSYLEMMTDVRRRAGKPSRDFVPLPSTEQLALDERVVIVYGTARDETLPVACAELEVDPDPDIN